MEPYRPYSTTDYSGVNAKHEDQVQLVPKREKRPKTLAVQATTPHRIRVAFRVIALAFSFALVVIMVKALIVYERTKSETFTYPRGTTLSAWPQSLQTGPTALMLVAAVVSVKLNILSLLTLCACFRKLRAKRIGPIMAMVSSFLAFIVSTAAVVYYKSWDTGKKSQSDIWNWTCTHKDIEVRVENKDLGFSTVCQEMVSNSLAINYLQLTILKHFGFWAGVIVAVVEFLNFILSCYSSVHFKLVRSDEPDFHLQTHTYAKLPEERQAN
ncbi:hypothetical protein LTR84_009141 [Exophiala bonariae]|uniref:Uncharacterized protein n=1 Tax=Exophiala bonariae TaxID=1690606 RepID=A0AAV9MY31_9EURO|nr:hypothetical protein LTR84_009141 [Exophiala bonariae]